MTTSHETETLRRLLRQDDRTVAWLARRTEWSKPHLARVASGERPMTAPMRAKFAEVFGVDAGVFSQEVAAETK